MGRSGPHRRHAATTKRHARRHRSLPRAKKTRRCWRARRHISPHLYQAANFRVLGEAEGIIDKFVEAWEAGAREGLFEAEKFQIDVTKSPVPRFDLLKFDDYLHIGVQFSRGCPFTCEFCDIIELYGRVPRAKTNAQMLAELDQLYRLGYRGYVDFVDDNLIGNKKAVKAFLPALANWLEARDYPFKFTTEASLNLADDAEFLVLINRANFVGVFVGIENPDTATLIAMRKKQNTRRNIAQSIHKIYAAGLFVTAGFIVGFVLADSGSTPAYCRLSSKEERAKLRGSAKPQRPSANCDGSWLTHPCRRTSRLRAKVFRQHHPVRPTCAHTLSWSWNTAAYALSQLRCPCRWSRGSDPRLLRLTMGGLLDRTCGERPRASRLIRRRRLGDLVG